MNYYYSIFIQWSEEDNKFIAHLPEFGPYAHTHGETYHAARHNALDVLDLVIDVVSARGKALARLRAISAVR